MSKKIYPSREWKTYWQAKRQHVLSKGQEFNLSQEECAELSRRADAKGIKPSYREWHLGRKDHSKGYSKENVKWENAHANRRESSNRRWASFRKENLAVRKR